MDDESIAHIHTLLENAPDEVRDIVLNGSIDSSIETLTNTYHLTVTEAIAVKNTILLTLLGVIATNEVDGSLAKDISLPEDERGKLLKDIDAGIFEKARISLFGKEYEEGHEVRTLSVGEEENKKELREQILSNTNRDSAITTPPQIQTPPVTIEKKDTSPVLPGSRSELLERMSVLDAIPKNEEIEERLAKIQSQFQTKEEEKKAQEQKEEAPLPSSIDKEEIKQKIVFPTHYAVDPYREITE